MAQKATIYKVGLSVADLPRPMGMRMGQSCKIWLSNR
jgi:uncharacterized protein YaeQ